MPSKKTPAEALLREAKSSVPLVNLILISVNLGVSITALLLVILLR